MSDVVTSDQVAATVTGMLAKNRGVFIGEAHDDELAGNFTTTHMLELKKAGVSTIYVEYNAYKTHAAQGGQECREEYMGPSMTAQGNEANKQVSNMQSVVEAATLAGLRVIGHDSTNGNSWQWDRIDADPKLLDALVKSGDGMDKRNDYATNLINDTYDGKKFIVYGGLSHGNHDIDTPSHKSLPEKLGIPSISFSTHAQNYYAREGALTKLGGMIDDVMAINDAPPLHMKQGVDGDSTVKVFSTNGMATIPANATSAFAGLDVDKLEGIESAIRQSGACKLPERFAHQDVIPLKDAEAFVSNINAGKGKSNDNAAKR